jgi:hypothetical protein
MNKRFLYLSIVFIIVNLQLLKADYFTTSYSGNPFCPMGFLVTSVSAQGNLLQAGDEVGIFDGSLCVGHFIYDDHQTFGMTSSMNDPSSKTVGFLPGHPISFRIWIKKTNQLMRNVSVKYSPGVDSMFKPYGIAIIELSGKEDPQKPDIIPGQSFTIAENLPANLNIGNVNTNYPVDGVYYFEIESGNTGKTFAIDSVEGTLSVNQNSSLNFEVTSTYNLVIKVYNAKYNWVYDTALVQILVTRVNNEPGIEDKLVDTAYVGVPFTRKIDISTLKSTAISVSTIQLPSWLNYSYDNNNALIIEGIAQNKDLGEYSLVLGISDGNNRINRNIDLKVMENNNPLSINIRNNPSHGNFTLVIEPDSKVGKIDVAIFNAAGSVIYNQSFENESNQLIVPIDLTNKPKSTYFLEVSTAKSRVTGNLVLL